MRGQVCETRVSSPDRPGQKLFHRPAIWFSPFRLTPCGNNEMACVRSRCALMPLGERQPQNRELDPVDQVSTLWITLPPSGPTKRASRAGRAVSAVALFGCQKDSCFYSWNLWITPLILRVIGVINGTPRPRSSLLGPRICRNRAAGSIRRHTLPAARRPFHPLPRDAPKWTYIIA